MIERREKICLTHSKAGKKAMDTFKEEKMSILFDRPIEERVNYREGEVIDKSFNIAGFVLPPLTGLTELGTAAISWVHFKRKLVKKIDQRLKELCVQEATCLKINHLFKGLAKNSDLTNKYPAHLHQVHITNAAHKFIAVELCTDQDDRNTYLADKEQLKTYLVENYKTYAEYLPMLNQNYPSINESSSILEDLRKKDVPQLFSELSTINDKAEKLMSKKTELEQEFKNSVTQFENLIAYVRQMSSSIQAGLDYLQNQEASKQKSIDPPLIQDTMKDNPSFSHLQQIATATKENLIAVDALSTRIFNKIQDAIREELPKRNSIGNRNTFCRQALEGLISRFNSDNTPKEIILAKKLNKLDLLGIRAEMVLCILKCARYKRAMRERAIHGAACLTIAGAYWKGASQLRERKRRKEQERIVRATQSGMQTL
jgi:hypothetical protein